MILIYIIAFAMTGAFVVEKAAEAIGRWGRRR